MASSSAIPTNETDDSPRLAQPHAREEEEGDATAALEAPSDDSDDEVADFRNLLPQLIAEKEAAAKAGTGLTSSTAAGGTTALGQTHIPKRGEKDFEPTGFRGQEKKLEESRRAMELVIGQSRRTTNKSLSTAIWCPKLNRAIVDVSRGTILASMGVTVRAPITASSASEIPSSSTDVLGPDNQVGVWKAGIFYPRYASRLELLPEEALYLIERATLDCTVGMRLRDASAEDQEVQVPLSLQHAFSLMLNKDGCTRERYQVYSYLKRLGYYVQRASVTEDLRKAAALAKKKQAEADHHIATPSDVKEEQRKKTTTTSGIVSDPSRPLRLVTLFDLLLYIPRRLIQIGSGAASKMTAWLSNLFARMRRRQPRNQGITSRGRGLLGLNSQQLTSYDQIFSALQIIPSGHDSSKASSKHSIDATTGPTSAPNSASPMNTADPSSKNDFLPFFYAWRPATNFRKTHPPLPEFRISIVSARETSLPKLHEFQEMFQAVPLETTTTSATDANDDVDEEERKRAAEEKRRNDESYGKGFLAKKKREDIAAKRLAASAKGDDKDSTSGPSPADDRADHETSQSRLRSAIASLLGERLTSLLDQLWSRAVYLLPFFGSSSANTRPAANGRDSSASQRGGRGGGRGGRGRGRGGAAHSGPPRRPNPFPPLKAGRRNVILAVVDHGTTSLLRFGEAEFDKWKLRGDGC